MEGISYLVLVFIAMPLKYLYENTKIVKSLGMVHGILFILFAISLVYFIKSNHREKGLGIDLFNYSLIPFGFMLIEYRIRIAMIPKS
ncbi:DUF3817 domain-containing protein [Sulfurimonas sp.]|uniref:DUF3817 domain-containing protein n=1 Tax=Sulfurimonas sp. TaxID=2022749 RepID=UPI0034525526